jgi:hypothetical protein
VEMGAKLSNLSTPTSSAMFYAWCAQPARPFLRHIGRSTTHADRNNTGPVSVGPWCKRNAASAHKGAQSLGTCSHQHLSPARGKRLSCGHGAQEGQQLPAKLPQERRAGPHPELWPLQACYGRGSGSAARLACDGGAGARPGERGRPSLKCPLNPLCSSWASFM